MWHKRKVGHYKKINDCLLMVLLFFGLFDVARNYTKLPTAFGYLKDISIYLLILLNFYRLVLPRWLGKSFYIWGGSALLFSSLGFINSGTEFLTIFVACIKYLELFLLIILFSNWQRIFGIEMHRFMRLYIVGAALLCFVNVFGYYVDNPIVSIHLANANMNASLYDGRVTVGQPALAVFPVLFAFVWLLLYGKSIKAGILLLVYMTCIVVSTSNTGILSLVLSVLLVIVYILFVSHEKRVGKNMRFFIAAVLLLALFVVLFAEDFVSSVQDIYAEKLGQYFKGQIDSSMALRHSHWEQGIASMSGIDFLFGRGVYGYVTDEVYPMENTFVTTFVIYGGIGCIAMICFFAKNILHSLLCIRKNKRSALMSVCVYAIILLHMYTLDMYMCYTLVFSSALWIVYCHASEKRYAKVPVRDCLSAKQYKRIKIHAI